MTGAVAELDQLAAALRGLYDAGQWLGQVEETRRGILASGRVDTLDELRIWVARKVVAARPGAGSV